MRSAIPFLTFLIALQGCMIVRKPSADELAALDNPPAAVRARVEALLPKVDTWYMEAEQQLAPAGRALTDEESGAALALGVKNPGLIRVVVRENFPMPTDEALLAEAKKYGLGGVAEGGRCHGYVILLKPGVAASGVVLRHELVHVTQLERMGRTNFLRRYLTELEIMGYARSPLELEAYSKQGSTK